MFTWGIGPKICEPLKCSKFFHMLKGGVFEFVYSCKIVLYTYMCSDIGKICHLILVILLCPQNGIRGIQILSFLSVCLLQKTLAITFEP